MLPNNPQNNPKYSTQSINLKLDARKPMNEPTAAFKARL
jgi:hypothetical protein